MYAKYSVHLKNIAESIRDNCVGDSWGGRPKSVNQVHHVARKATDGRETQRLNVKAKIF